MWGYSECFCASGLSTRKLKCGTGTDSLEHIFQCPTIRSQYKSNSKFQDIYSKNNVQKEAVGSFIHINKIKSDFIECEICLPVQSLDTCTLAGGGGAVQEGDNML